MSIRACARSVALTIGQAAYKYKCTRKLYKSTARLIRPVGEWIVPDYRAGKITAKLDQEFIAKVERAEQKKKSLPAAEMANKKQKIIKLLRKEAIRSKILITICPAAGCFGLANLALNISKFGIMSIPLFTGAINILPFVLCLVTGILWTRSRKRAKSLERLAERIDSETMARSKERLDLIISVENKWKEAEEIYQEADQISQMADEVLAAGDLQAHCRYLEEWRGALMEWCDALNDKDIEKYFGRKKIAKMVAKGKKHIAMRYLEIKFIKTEQRAVKEPRAAWWSEAKELFAECRSLHGHEAAAKMELFFRATDLNKEGKDEQAKILLRWLQMWVRKDRED